MQQTKKIPRTEQEEFENAVTPLMEYLKSKYHPHVTAIVTSNSVEILEGLKTYKSA